MVKLSIHNLLKLLLPLLLIYGSKQCYADTVSIPLRYYHSDHLGSASWITNGSGNPVQHLQYMPYGEPFVNERTSSYNERFTFTGKERDSETGFSYFGARYYDSDLMTSWLSVDPMADKYPGVSPYAYCAWNPVRLVDPDGEDIEIVDNDGKKYTWAINGKIYYGRLEIKKQYQSENVKKKVDMLNKIYATSAGKKVLQELVSAEETYSITNESPTNKNAPASYDGGENKFKMGKSNDISVFAHELFHAYQDQKGRNNPSIYNEVEAYVFQGKIMDQLGIDSKFNSGISSSNNSKYEKSMNNLVKKFSAQDFNYAISNFRKSANANKNGDYKGYDFIPSGFNSSNSLLIGL